MRENWALFNLVYVQSGWQRFLPSSAIAILSFLATHGTASPAELNEELQDGVHTSAGLTSNVWEPTPEYTDEELRQLDHNNEDAPIQIQRSHQRTARAVNDEAHQKRIRDIAELEAYSSHLGLPSVRTLADLLDFMTAASVLLLAHGEYSINPFAPLPEDVFPLSETRREAEAHLRWGQLHQDLAQRIIALFNPGGLYSVNSLSTTIDGLAQSLQAHPRSIREALVVLVDDKDFTVTGDLLHIAADERLNIDVNWEAFYESRFSVRFNEPPAEDN
jgi:hypothetical protein